MAKRLGANRRQKMASKRAKRKNGKAVVRAAVALVLVTLVGFSAALGVRKAADWAAGARILKIDEIAVRGAKNVDSAAVLALAAVEPGTSLFGLKTAEVRERLRSNVWVSRAQVQRLLPGKVTIKIEERTAVALVNLGAIHQVDAEGVLLPLTPGQCASVPVLTGMRDTIGADSLRRLDESSLARMNRLLAALRRSKNAAAKRVCQVRFDDAGMLTLKVEGSPVVIALEEGRLPQGLERLERVMRFAEARGDCLRYVNLCYDNRAYVR